MTRQEIWQLLERESSEVLGCTASEALAKLDLGELPDSALADELTMLRALLTGS